MSARVEPTSIRRRLERTALLAVLLGYGLLVLANVQLFQQQRNQRQLTTMQRAERLLRSNAALAGQPQQLQRLFGAFSSSNLAVWGHFSDQQPVDAALMDPSADLRQRAEQLAQNRSRPQLFRNRSSSYMVISRVVNLNGNPFHLYLLEDVSAEVAFQHQCNALLLLAAVLAALVSVLLNRRGIYRALQPLTRLGDRLETLCSNPLQHQPLTPDQQPLELKPLAAAVNDLGERLAKALDHQQQFASSVSHELRNPITIIGGYNRRLMRRAKNLTDDQRRQLLIVEEEIRRLGQLVIDLVTITRAEISAQSLDCQPLCIADLVQQAIALVDPQEQPRIVVNPADGVDPRLIEVFADRDAVLQCLVHLFNNACQYSPPASPVEIGYLCRAERVFLQIRDHGPGVPAEERQLVFERFRRGRNSEGSSGSGIGLAVVQTLVDPMAGSVSIEDAEGGGAIVVLGLRRCSSPAPEVHPPLH
ncbi:Signal transduction histidine-protein kinase ArlS [Synechococcus sp. MIT S9509]|uniref:sensor histidine kinase n=1 Tax=Synechococcus sp. MIT S9509 TaxID=1801630 RepID=UPI0007BC5A9E|nr:HAMP domain-containing sensor histidine kinase [Synechococcus sp. MIT S9509]KZR92345.1 Signal transduction histidine-protein kinase ArlS [Synechococcus sp. MIT S9509]